MANLLDMIFGQKPKVAKFKPINFGQEQTKTIGADISAFPQIEQLGNLYQSYATQQMETAMPGFSNLLKSGTSTTQEMLDAAAPMLKGEIPQDVKDQVLRSDAYQALSGGYGGSQMSHDLTARDLGLTSLDLMGRGASLAGQGGNAAQRWASLARGEMLDPASMFVTPQQTAAFDLENRILKKNQPKFQYNVNAAPDPAAAGISNTISSLVGAYLGRGMGNSSGFAQAGKTSVPYNAGMMDYGQGFGMG